VKANPVAALVLIVALAGACRVEKGTFGGDPERALLAATAARDVAKVRALLATGADPNKMVRGDEGLYRSPWQVALEQIRPRQPEHAAIVRAMLEAGANTESAWGESMSRGITRRYAREPIMVAMLHPDAGVIRALMDAKLDRRLAKQALVMSIESGDIDVAHVLVDAGVDVNCTTCATTALVAAVEVRDMDLITYLEAHGAREKP
jgi:hypothetical protein